jgi:1-deoxy-D-xylulose-5-phosphate reductoisomerase
MNGANEEAVALFLADKIGFYDIYELVSGAVAATEYMAAPTLEQILETDRLARAYVQAQLRK